MRLRVLVGGSAHGVTNYLVQPHRYRPAHQRGVFYPEDVKRLKSLKDRINGMARQELGKAYKGMVEWSDHLELRVKQGTSRHPSRRFEFRELVGWICLMDAEPKRAVA